MSISDNTAGTGTQSPLQGAGGASKPSAPTYLELQQECQRLQAELTEVKAERDSYRKAAFAYMPREEFNFTKEELFAQLGKEPPLRELIAELEKELGA